MKITWFKNNPYVGNAALKKNNGKVSPAYLMNTGTVKQLTQYATTDLDIGVVQADGFIDDHGVKYFMVALKNPVEKNQFVYVKKDDWLFVKTKATQDSPSTREKAKALLEEIIENDRKIFNKIISLAKQIDIAKAKGKDTAAAEKAVMIAWKELVGRQLSMISSGYMLPTDTMKIAQPAIISGIGVAPLVVAIIVAGVIILAALFIWSFKSQPYRQAKDLESLDKWGNVLESDYNVPKEKVDEIKKEVNDESKAAQDDAYNKGKGEGNSNTVKLIAIAVLGYFGLDALVNRKTKQAAAK